MTSTEELFEVWEYFGDCYRKREGYSLQICLRSMLKAQITAKRSSVPVWNQMLEVIPSHTNTHNITLLVIRKRYFSTRIAFWTNGCEFKTE